MISWTNLLTRCHSASCLFSAVFGSRKSENEYSRNWTGQKPKLLFSRKTHGARRRVGEGPQGGHTLPGAGTPRPRQGMVWAPWPATDLAPSLIYASWDENPKSSIRNPRKVPQRRRHRRGDSGDRKSLFRHPAGTGKCPRSHLHRSPPPSPSPLLIPMMRRE